MNYAHGSNMPGCMPDSLFVSATFADAQAATIWDLKFYEDVASSEDEAEEYCAAAEDVNLWSGPDSVTVAGRVFYIAETDEDADR